MDPPTRKAHIRHERTRSFRTCPLRFYFLLFQSSNEIELRKHGWVKGTVCWLRISKLGFLGDCLHGPTLWEIITITIATATLLAVILYLLCQRKLLSAQGKTKTKLDSFAFDRQLTTAIWPTNILTDKYDRQISWSTNSMTDKFHDW